MDDGEPRFYRYILASDDGWAPCIKDGLVTLATCKPKIRSVAKERDWVAGFIPGSQHRGLVAWIGRIAKKYPVGGYEEAYRGRPDANYRGTPGQLERVNPLYHPGEDEFRKDTSAPALVFDMKSTWYFGDKPHALPSSLIELAAKGQGHRVNHRLPGDLEAIHSWLMAIGPPGIHGKPRDGGNARECGGCSPLGVPVATGQHREKRC